MIRKMLVPIDGSETAVKALEYAIDLAKQTGSTIILLSVVDKSPYYGAQTVSVESSLIHMLENLEDYFRQTAEAYVADAEGLCKTKEVGSQKNNQGGTPGRGNHKGGGGRRSRPHSHGLSREERFRCCDSRQCNIRRNTQGVEVSCPGCERITVNVARASPNSGTAPECHNDYYGNDHHCDDRSFHMPAPDQG